ncbi:MAG: pro-sigmaK processing inhibitor BofA [Tissierellia bacterium]|nr:pro-sigmaK processing inhibitor BofA [Tissierellia bacterium]
MDMSTILAFIFGLFLLYVVGMLLVIPIKLIIRLIINGVIGGIVLLLFNLVGGFIGLSLVINPLTAVITGFLGIPGIILLLLMQKIL